MGDLLGEFNISNESIGDGDFIGGLLGNSDDS